jgi:hypothetical protein
VPSTIKLEVLRLPYEENLDFVGRYSCDYHEEELEQLPSAPGPFDFLDIGSSKFCLTAGDRSKSSTAPLVALFFHRCVAAGR